MSFSLQKKFISIGIMTFLLLGPPFMYMTTLKDMERSE